MFFFLIQAAQGILHNIFPGPLQSSVVVQATLLLAAIVGGMLLLGQLVAFSLNLTIGYLGGPQVNTFYNKVIRPRQSLLGWVLALALLDLAMWLFFRLMIGVAWYPNLEFGLTLLFTLALGWLGSRLFKEYFDSYVLDAAATTGKKINSELLVLARFFVNFGIVIVLTLAFGQTHNLNIFGIIASLGVGGIAIAFAAQKVLEQLLGGVVIYVDRPFGIDDYIGLPDGTYGRVESIGLRSTRIRTSGKGTLAIVPNNALIQSTIENFTGAKKVMALLYLNFYRTIPLDEQALIRQVVLSSTGDVAGLDSRSTDLVFVEQPKQERTQAQITFFLLGSERASMDIRRQLLDIANQNLAHQLKEYGIAFDVDAPTVYVDSPITI